MEEIKVLVPEERVSEFYRWFADWTDGVLAPANGVTVSKPERDEDGQGSLAEATKFWNSLRPKERAIWSLWIDASPRMLTADEIVRDLKLKGPRDIPGILSWSSRKGAKVGFRVSWRFRTDAVTGAPIYGIEDEEYATLLGRARDANEDDAR